MQSRVSLRARHIAIGIAVANIVLALVGWGVVRHDAARVASLRDGMSYEELEALYGKPLWNVGRNDDLAYVGRDVRFRAEPLVGHCLNRAVVGGRDYATAEQLPRITSPWSARQVWLFRTGLVSGILVYPGDDGRARCILQARPSGWSVLLH